MWSLDCENNQSDQHFGAVAGEGNYRFQKHSFFLMCRLYERTQKPEEK